MPTTARANANKTKKRSRESSPGPDAHSVSTLRVPIPLGRVSQGIREGADAAAKAGWTGLSDVLSSVEQTAFDAGRNFLDWGTGVKEETPKEELLNETTVNMSADTETGKYLDRAARNREEAKAWMQRDRERAYLREQEMLKRAMEPVPDSVVEASKGEFLEIDEEEHDNPYLAQSRADAIAQINWDNTEMQNKKAHALKKARSKQYTGLPMIPEPLGYEEFADQEKSLLGAYRQMHLDELQRRGLLTPELRKEWEDKLIHPLKFKLLSLAHVTGDTSLIEKEITNYINNINLLTDLKELVDLVAKRDGDKPSFKDINDKNELKKYLIERFYKTWMVLIENPGKFEEEQKGGAKRSKRSKRSKRTKRSKRSKRTKRSNRSKRSKRTKRTKKTKRRTKRSMKRTKRRTMRRRI